MNILLYGTTYRAVKVLKLLRELAPKEELYLVSALPSSLEPDYLPDLHKTAQDIRANSIDLAITNYVPPDADVILCVNWRKKISSFGKAGESGNAFVLHDSLLPKYRGFSPLVHAIRNGDTTTGVTMFRPTEEIDAGPIVAQEEINIEGLGIAQATHRMTEAYVKVITSILPLVLEGFKIEDRLQLGPISYAPRIDWEKDPEINPEWSDEKIANHIRAFSPPYPRAFIKVGNRKIYVS